MNKDNGRSVNILLCIAGVLCCIGSGFVTAPQGLLADDSVNIIQAIQPSHMLIYFAVPSVLMILACILVIAGKMDILSICSVLVGGVLFAMMDFQFGVSHRTFSGILINMIGVILVAAAVALQVFATETGPAKVSRKAAKKRNPKEFRYERSHRPAYDDIYLDTSGSLHNTVEGASTETSAEDEYLALDTLKAEELEAEAEERTQKEQENEIAALLAALDTDQETNEKTTAETEAQEISLIDFDAESETLLAEVEAETQQAEEALSLEMPAISAGEAMAHMAEALETPNQMMTDFYDGIEDIFLDQDNQ